MSKVNKLRSIGTLLFLISIAIFLYFKRNQISTIQINIEETSYKVAVVILDKPLEVALHYDKKIDELDNWRELVLAYESDYSKHLSEDEKLKSCEVGYKHREETLNLISRIIARYDTATVPKKRTVKRLIVANNSQDTYLIIPSESELGITWSTYIWVDGAWKFGAPTLVGRKRLDNHAVKLDHEIVKLLNQNKVSTYPESKLSSIVSKMHL